MATLTGQTIASTYDALLKVTDNGPITSSLKLITDGLGNNTALSLSNAGASITGTFSVSSTISASNISGTNTGDETTATIKTKLGAASASQDGYLTSTDWSTFNSKENTLTFSSPLSRTTNTISIPVATSSVNGYLSSTDWTTFNSKQSALTNPITGTGTTNTLPKFSGTSALSNSNITDSGTLISLGSNTTISSGGLGIGSTNLTDNALRISKTITGSTTASGILITSAIQSDVTSSAIIFQSTPSQATGGTLTTLYHFSASQSTLNGTVTTQIGYQVFASMSGATNNRAFQGQIATGTNNYNLYMSGTAANYIEGSLGIGTAAVTGYNVRISKQITGATTSYGIHNSGTVQTDVTAVVANFQSVLAQAAGGTLTDLYHYRANQGTISGTVTNQYGFAVESSINGATNNYGFYGNIASATNRWNLYIVGTARNYLNGTTSIGSTADNGSGAKLQVTGGITYQNIFNRQTASYTLALTDQNDIIEMNVATANNLTVPLNSSVAFPIGTEIAIMQYGAGQTTIVATGGVTLRAKSGALKISGQYAGCTLVKVGTNEWYVVGDLTI